MSSNNGRDKRRRSASPEETRKRSLSPWVRVDSGNDENPSSSAIGIYWDKANNAGRQNGRKSSIQQSSSSGEEEAKSSSDMDCDDDDDHDDDGDENEVSKEAFNELESESDDESDASEHIYDSEEDGK